MATYNARISPVNVDTITALKNVVPGAHGYSIANSFFGTVPNTSLVGARDVYTAKYTDNTLATYVVTPAAIYTVIGGQLAEEHLVANTQSSFTMLGNTCFIAINSQLLRRTSTDTSWTVVTNAPAMDYITTSLGMVFGAKGTNWYSSAINDYDTWTPTQTNTASSGVFYNLTSNVTGLVSFKDDIIIINSNNILLAKYIDNTINWVVTTLDSDVGGSKILNTSIGVLVYSDQYGLRIYNGNQVNMFGLELPEDFKATGLMYNYPNIYCTTATGIMLYSLIYNSWGNIDFGTTYRTLLIYSKESATIQSMDTTYSTIGNVSDILQFGIVDNTLPVLGYISNSGEVLALGEGVGVNNYSVTYGIQGSYKIIKLVKVLIDMETNNSKHTCTVNYGDTLVLGSRTNPVNYKYNKFSVIKSSKWFQCTLSGDYTSNDTLTLLGSPVLVFGTEDGKS